MAEKTGNAFDMKIFIRLMGFAKKYRVRFFTAAIATILLAGFSTLTPYVLILTVDDFVAYKDIHKLFINIIIMACILGIEVLLNLRLSIFLIG